MQPICRRKLTLLTVLLTIFFAQAAFANIVAVGPPNPVDGVPTFPGFPMYYKDSNGVMVELPQPPVGTAGGALVIPTPPTMIFDAPIIGDPLSMGLGFGTEAFYWFAHTRVQSKFGSVRLIFGLEATYLVPGNPDTAVVFFRIRLVAQKFSTPGIYFLHHPWGTETIIATSADQRHAYGFPRGGEPPAGGGSGFQWRWEGSLES